MTVRLLDVNLLIALAWPDHIHHAVAHRWFAATGRKSWATCPLTQLAFVRISSNPKIVTAAVSPRQAARMLASITSQPGHQFWSDSLETFSIPEFSNISFVGHRQVTDAYLIGLARHRKGKLVTLDQGLAALVADDAERKSLIEILSP